MNELFRFHKELNMKKVLILIIILVLTIFLISFIFIFKNNKNKIDNKNPNSTFISKNNSLSLELPKHYNFSKVDSIQDYILELRSPNNINIFVSEKNLIENKSFNEVVNADKKAYIESFNRYSNLSEISELTVNNFPAYSYSFHYLDNKKVAYYLQIIWIKTDNKYYIFDIEFPLNSLDSNHTIMNDIISKFKIISESNSNL